MDTLPGSGDSSKGGDVVYSSIGMYAIVTGYEGEPTSLVISDRYDGLPAAMIQRGSFSDCETLVSVTVPSSVNAIAPYAFSGCTNLTSVKFASPAYVCGHGENLAALLSFPESAAAALTGEHAGCGFTRS